MRTFTSLALVAALGLGAATLSKPADAGVVVGVGVGLPGVAVAALPAPVVASLPVVYPGYYRYPRCVPGLALTATVGTAAGTTAATGARNALASRPARP